MTNIDKLKVLEKTVNDAISSLDKIIAMIDSIDNSINKLNNTIKGAK